MVREAVALGISPEDAIVMASFNPAQWHGLHHLGAVAAGYQADLLLLPDLVSFAPDLVLKRGRPIEDVPSPPVPEWVRQTVRVKPVTAADFEIPSDGATIRAIGLIEDQVVTESLEREPVVVDGYAVANADAGLAKIAVVERHLATGRIGLGFVSGSGLTRGALASSVAHDAHNLVVVGMSDNDMAFAVAHLAEIGGGIVVVDDGRVVAECPLPVAGLLSDAPLATVIEQSLATNEAAHELGWSGATPFLTLAFLALSVIPSLKITDRGLVDVDRFEIVPLEVRRMTEIRTGLTYDDVLLVPRRSRVRSRQDVSTRSSFTPGIELEVPIVSANMDTVTTAPMAVAMAQLGGIGVAAPVPPGRGGGGGGAQGQALPDARRRRAVRDRAGPHASRTRGPRRTGSQVTGFVVVDPEQRLLGLLTARDMLAGEDGQRVDELMTPRERLVTGRARDRARGRAPSPHREPGREAPARRRRRQGHGPRHAARPLARRPLSRARRATAWAGSASRPRSGSAATTSFARRR